MVEHWVRRVRAWAGFPFMVGSWGEFELITLTLFQIQNKPPYEVMHVIIVIISVNRSYEKNMFDIRVHIKRQTEQEIN